MFAVTFPGPASDDATFPARFRFNALLACYRLTEPGPRLLAGAILLIALRLLPFCFTRQSWSPADIQQLDGIGNYKTLGTFIGNDNFGPGIKLEFPQ